MNKKDSGIENLESRMLAALGEKSLKNLAEKLEINYYTLRNYAKGDRDMPTSLLEKFAKMSINLNWLLTGEGSMRIQEEPEKANLISEIASDSADEEELAILFHDYKELQEEHRDELRGLLKYVAHEVKRHREKQRRGNESSDLTSPTKGVESARS